MGDGVHRVSGVTMGKKTGRWPIWKIAAATAACAVASPVLFWLAVVTERTVEKQAAVPSDQTAVITPSSFITMLGAAAGMLGVLGVIWLVLRIREARTPVWKRPGRKKRL
jgi:hypothetical protein